MADCVAVAPELPFRQQIIEVVTHLSRCSSDQTASRELISTFDAQLKPEEGQSAVSDERKKEIVRAVAAKYKEMKGALDGAKESDAESSHLLLQYLLSTTFGGQGAEYEELFKGVVEGVKEGGEAAASAGRTGRAEAACRILSNTYNSLPASSSLRPQTLLSLLALLSQTAELSSLPLSTSYLTQSLSQWSLSPADAHSFLTSASEIFQSAGDLSKALELLLLAGDAAGEKAVVLAVADSGRYELGAVEGLKVEGKAAELRALFEGEDELQGVAQGKEWVGANASWIEGFGIPQFSADGVLRKLRLIALASLCAKSASRQLAYEDVASALQIDVKEVEGIVIDAIRSKLIAARLSQPTSTIRIQSVSSFASRNFGPSEWQLLERRLGEWKKSVEEARKAIDEAEAVAAQGPITHQQRRGGGDRRERGQQQQQQQSQQEAEVAA